MPSKLQRWLNGTFTCRKCGKEFNTMTFGYRGCICPKCYDGEHSFMFFDKSFWLNRVIAKLIRCV